MAHKSAIKIPDLTRLRKAKGKIINEVRLRDFIFQFSRLMHFKFPDTIRHDQKYASIYDPYWYDYFCSYFNVSDATYRRDMLGLLLENADFKTELRAIADKIPRRDQLQNLSESLDRRASVYEEHDNCMAVRNTIELPMTIEKMVALEGKGEAIDSLREFAREARTSLSDFIRACDGMKPEMLADSKSNTSGNLLLAREYAPKIVPFLDLISDIAHIKREIEHYLLISMIYDIKPNIGDKAPFCKPEFLDPELRQGTITQAYHPFYHDYALSQGCCVRLSIPNDIHWGDDARHSFIQGPNSMGKTVYLNNVGFNIQLVMAGLYPFATSCQMSPVRMIHVCNDSGDTDKTGHFETGGKLIDHMLDKIGKYDVVLMDEAGGGTEPEAERIIAKGISDGLIAHGLTFFGVTHDMGAWNEYVGKLGIRMLRSADREDKERKYKIWEGIADSGYAMKFAKELRIDPESVMQRLDQRLGRQK